MKAIKKIILLSFGVFVVTLSFSCTDNFTQLNTDPSLVTRDVVDPDVLFTSGERDFLYSIPGLGRIDEYSGYYSNQASGNIFQDIDWSWSYDGYLMNNEEVIRLTADDPRLANKNAIARIWKIAMFHPVTDAFGDVPYSEALLDASETITQPKYDTQESIYKSMLNGLKDAAASLSDSEDRVSFGTSDLIYGGDVDMWRRFANSLRLRLAMRVRYVDPQLAEQHISEVINEPLIESNSQNPSFTTMGEDATDTGNRNPIYNRVLNAPEPPWAGYTITSVMNMRDDPRRPVYFDMAADSTSGYNGRPIQPTQEQKDAYAYTVDNTASFGDLFTEAAYTINVMQYAEVQFLKAEAYLTGLASGNAEATFQEGIRASMEYYNLDEADIVDYLSSEGTLPTDEEQALKEIIVQKFIANYQLEEEAWAEYRRTGYPLIYKGGEKGVTDGEIPRRETYPEVEYSINEANVTEAASRLEGGDKLTSRIWWDAKPGLPYTHPDQGTYPPPKY